MHLGFTGLTNGVRVTNSGSLNELSVPPQPLHVRTGSASNHDLPAGCPLPPSQMAEASSASNLPHEATPSAAITSLLDPMVEFTPEMFNNMNPNWIENQRFSVAW